MICALSFDVFLANERTTSSFSRTLFLLTLIALDPFHSRALTYRKLSFCYLNLALR